MITTCRSIFFVLWIFLLTVQYLAGFPSAEARPQSIKVVMDNNYPPYVFYDSTGKLHGILIDQWRLWEQKTGISVDIHAMDWSRTISGMKAGQFDVIDSIFKTEERSGWLDFSRPYADIEVPIFFDKNISGIADTASLKNFSVATKTGDAAVDLLKQNGVANLMLFNSYEAIILAAKEHKISVFVIDAPPALYFLYKHGINDHYKQSPPLNIGQFHRAVKKGNNDLLNVVEDGFKQIPANELKKIETKWNGSALYDGRMPHYLFFFVGSLALLTLFFFAWNHVLRKTVATRTAELKNSVKALQTLYMRQNAVLKAVPDIIMEVDNNKVYTWANSAGLEFFGEDVVGKKAEFYFAGEQNTYAAVQPLFEGTVAVLYVESWQRRKDGETRLLAWWCRELKDDTGNGIGAISTARDITEHRWTEAALIESEDKLQVVFKRAPVGLFLMNRKSVVLDCNQHLLSMFGVRREEFVGRNLLDRMPEGLAHQILVDAISSDGVHSYEGPYASISSGKKLYVSISCEKIAPDLIIAIVVDITGRMLAEEAIKDREQLFRAVFMGSPAALAITTQEDGIWISANQTELDMFGYSREELIGKSVMDTNLWVDQNDRQRLVVALTENREVKNEITQLRRKDGSLFFASVSANSLTLKGIKHILFATEDITERRVAEEKIKASLQEKEVLLREIHHRVKNNMQVISSLLFLQSVRAENEQARNVLLESQQRINAMAMIHETIYGSENLASIELSSYLKSLVNHLQGLHSTRTNIRMALELDKVNLDINQAVPCSLILNELISNAFKHAFPDGRMGTIQIKLRLAHDRDVLLEVSDDGIGLKVDLDLSNTYTLGLRLVQGLLKKQLKGSLDVVRDGGTAFILRWPLQD